MFKAILNNAAKGTFLKAPRMSLETKWRVCRRVAGRGAKTIRTMRAAAFLRGLSL